MKVKLEEQLEKIEKLRTDKHMQMLLLGIKCLGALDKKSDEVITNHLSKKNNTINNKLYQFREDLFDEFGKVANEFIDPASKEIGRFCGMGDYGIDGFLVYEYSNGDISLDELIERLKKTVVGISNTPEGFVMLEVDGNVIYISEAEFEAVFGNCDEE